MHNDLCDVTDYRAGDAAMPEGQIHPALCAAPLLQKGHFSKAGAAWSGWRGSRPEGDSFLA